MSGSPSPLATAPATPSAPVRMQADSPNLDLLRTFAVLVVVFSHLPIITDLFSSNHSGQGALGLLGVVIFFVHTSLVLMLSLERQTQTMGRALRASTFYIRRAFRIYPLSILLVVVVTLIAGLQGHPTDLKLFFSNLFLVQNLAGTESTPGQLWTLPYEVQMYVVLPLLFSLLLANAKRASRLVGALWFASAVLVLATWKLGWNYHLIIYLPCFLPGILAYTLLDREATLSPLWLAAYVAPMAFILPWLQVRGIHSNLIAWPVCLGLGLLIPRCREVKQRHLIVFGKLIARYSYGIYVVHTLCMDFWFEAVPRVYRPVQYVGALASIALLSFAVYHLVEKPFIGFGSRLAKLYPKYLGQWAA